MASKLQDGGRTQQPKTDEVVPEVRVVEAAEGATGNEPEVVPGPTTQSPAAITSHLNQSRVFVLIQAPFQYIAAHIKGFHR